MGALKAASFLYALAAFCLVAAAVPVRAEDCPPREQHATNWNGVRTELENDGLQVKVDYAAETFARDAEEVYRGNLDLQLMLDDKKALWKNLDDKWKSTVLVYGQVGHGENVSSGHGFLMPVSNYEGPSSFAQLSELWLDQNLPGDIEFRLGKQDANHDFAAPRFGGNFMNSSFGVLPTAPIPSYPAPALGAAAFWSAMDWLTLRGGVYEGDPRIESFGGHAFDSSAGTFAIGAAHIDVKQDHMQDTVIQFGGWHHSGLDRSGAFAILDVLIGPDRDCGNDRKGQFFARGNWEPDATAPDAVFYLGGGVTAENFVGNYNTVGLGGGFVSVSDAHQGFVELFFKWREWREWFTIEPDVQFYFLSGTHVFTGLRCKLKL